MKTIKTDVTFKKGEFTNNDGKLIEYVQVFILVNGIELKLKPADGTCASVIKAYVGSN